MLKTKNILIFGAAAIIMVLIYVFFIRSSPEDTASLISSPSVASVTSNGDNSSIAQDFLTLLLSVKNIKLDDAIFSDAAFVSLSDSSITLTPDGNEGRPNPFAPLEIGAVSPAEATPTPTTPTPTTPTNTNTSTSAIPIPPAGGQGTRAPIPPPQ